MPKVYSLRTKGYPIAAKKVDRTTPFGNPFILGKHGNRDQVCDMFATWVKQPGQARLRQLAKEQLKGCDLLCWCAPERCHASTWIEIANGE